MGIRENLVEAAIAADVEHARKVSRVARRLLPET
jgi:hypothetical protein